MGNTFDKLQWKKDDKIVGAYEFKQPMCFGSCGPSSPGFYRNKLPDDPHFEKARTIIENLLPDATEIVLETPTTQCCFCQCQDLSGAATNLNMMFIPGANEKLANTKYKIDAYYYYIIRNHGSGSRKEDHCCIRIWEK
eukprot:Rmarinus@m.12068